MALLGEYVVDICVNIERFLRDQLDGYPRDRTRSWAVRRFEPRLHGGLTRARAVSYWAEYYRLDFPRVETYPALRALGVIEGALR